MTTTPHATARHALAATALALLLSACGGGDDNPPPPTPPVANTTPVASFSMGAASVVAGTVTQMDSHRRGVRQ